MGGAVVLSSAVDASTPTAVNTNFNDVRDALNLLLPGTSVLGTTDLVTAWIDYLDSDSIPGVQGGDGSNKYFFYGGDSLDE